MAISFNIAQMEALQAAATEVQALRAGGDVAGAAAVEQAAWTGVQEMGEAGFRRSMRRIAGVALPVAGAGLLIGGLTAAARGRAATAAAAPLAMPPSAAAIQAAAPSLTGWEFVAPAASAMLPAVPGGVPLTAAEVGTVPGLFGTIFPGTPPVPVAPLAPVGAGVPGITFAGAAPAAAAAADPGAWSRFWDFVGTSGPGLIQALGIGTGAVAAGTGALAAGAGVAYRQVVGPATPAPAAIPTPVTTPGAPTVGTNWNMLYLMQ